MKYYTRNNVGKEHHKLQSTFSPAKQKFCRLKEKNGKGNSQVVKMLTVLPKSKYNQKVPQVLNDIQQEHGEGEGLGNTVASLHIWTCIWSLKEGRHATPNCHKTATAVGAQIKESD